jgi:ribosomal protein RSM22 (predicted rRNA methylase)
MLTKLQEAIAKELAAFPRSTLTRASAELTRHYKSAEASTPVREPALRVAYLAARLPATFAAVSRVLDEVRRLAAEVEINSLLDLGSGPGTALWATAEAWPSLERATVIEADAAWIEIGKRVAEQSEHAAVREAQWVRHDLRSGLDLPHHDVVMIAYALGELPTSAQESLLRRAIRVANKFLVVIEPGTVRGFGTIHGVRSALIAANTTILAPCPHRAICPLAAAGDWCHFSQRVARSSLHRQIKSGGLGYEDEKFSYIVAAKDGASPAEGSRIVRHPQKHSGHIQLTLCTPCGSAVRKTVSRADKEKYKLARRAEWGDLWKD